MSLDVRAAALVVLAALTTACSEDAGDAVTRWDEASARAGDETKVCGPPRTVRHTDEATLLDVGADFPDPDRFTIVVAEPSADVTAVSGADVVEVCATGEVSLEEGVAQVRLGSGSEIQVVTRADLDEQGGVPY
jgi:Tfp pilus assembly protein PilW